MPGAVEVLVIGGNEEYSECWEGCFTLWFFFVAPFLKLFTNKKFVMKMFIVILCMMCLVVFDAMSQQPFNQAAPNGYTKKATISEQVGLTEVKVSYHRPAVNGREGKIWGGVVHAGFKDQGFGNGKPAPWRAGANETTVIEFDHDVKVEGKNLAAGKYGLFIAYDSLESIIIFSRILNSWGSFFYDEGKDALRVKVKTETTAVHEERLKYEFTAAKPNAVTLALFWERKMIPFRIEVDHLKQQFDAFVAESQSPSGFTAQSLNVAATWALQNSYELETALQWASLSIAPKFPGNPTFFAGHMTKAAILEKLGKYEDAEGVLKQALALNINSDQKKAVERRLELLSPDKRTFKKEKSVNLQ